MKASRATGLKILLPYSLMGFPGWFNLMYVPGALIVPGDAATTARNIAAHELMYRLGILAGLLSSIGFLFLALSLYNLFRDVDRKQARLLVILVTAAAAIGCANLIHMIVPLHLLGGAEYLSTFTRAQLETLALGFIRLRGNGLAVEEAFWGLWLFPFGILVMRSGFFPRILGVFLVVGCFAYLATSLTAIVFPAYRGVVSQVALPFFALAEAPIFLWLLIKGVNVPTPEPRAAQAEPMAHAH